jgi:protoheme IX farnesyltransferase
MRPLPDGRVTSAEARLFGIVLSVAGLGILAGRANILSALLALLTLGVYLVVYTPMKRRTPAATLVGAVPGALPPLIGWAASHGSVDAGGASLFAIVFLWQIPHFMAIAWMYRDDYGAAGFPMLPVIDPGGARAGRQALIYALLLVPVSALPWIVGVAGAVYLAVAIVLGLAMAWLALRFHAARNDATARALFFASITYLPLLWIVMVLDKV